VCQLLYIIIFVPYNLFKLFLVHKISIYIYMKLGKRNGKRKKKGNSQLAGPRGEDFGPASAGTGRRPSRPTEKQSDAGRRRGCGPMRQREEGVTAWSERRRGGRTDRARPPVRFAAVLRREPGFATEEWWRGTGGGRGSWGRANLAGGCLGGRSTTRWWALVAVRSPARLPSAIGGEDGCIVFVREWRSSRTI
jgi:hypothetical protein